MPSNSDDFDHEKIELHKLTQAYSTNRLTVRLYFRPQATKIKCNLILAIF